MWPCKGTLTKRTRGSLRHHVVMLSQTVQSNLPKWPLLSENHFSSFVTLILVNGPSADYCVTTLLWTDLMCDFQIPIRITNTSRHESYVVDRLSLATDDQCLWGSGGTTAILICWNKNVPCCFGFMFKGIIAGNTCVLQLSTNWIWNCSVHCLAQLMSCAITNHSSGCDFCCRCHWHCRYCWCCHWHCGQVNM